MFTLEPGARRTQLLSLQVRKLRLSGDLPEVKHYGVWIRVSWEIRPSGQATQVLLVISCSSALSVFPPPQGTLLLPGPVIPSQLKFVRVHPYSLTITLQSWIEQRCLEGSPTLKLCWGLKKVPSPAGPHYL